MRENRFHLCLRHSCLALGCPPEVLWDMFLGGAPRNLSVAQPSGLGSPAEVLWDMLPAEVLWDMLPAEVSWCCYQVLLPGVVTR